ncbi:MAG: toll/interleukin-1 receptor domain-containing protein, partial [Propionibacteriaceae bacterium]|nr:toll/interleukin-1 receptor domain-containing protein [Propionibacteriaceae bacterium]
MDVLYGFLSYSHADDDAECGRIRHLGNDIASEYGLLTGQEIHLFIDKKDLQWGDVWEDVIGDNLAKAAFFIPIITPRFFASAACRKELNDFSLKADKLGLGDLILPIYYATYAGLESEESGDSLVASVSSRQWIDWRPLRFSERTSPEYRQKINDLATRLVSANSASERTAIRFSSSGLETESQTLLPSNEDETAGSDGILDTLAAMEASFPELEKCVERIAAVVSDIGSEAQKATAAMNKPLGGTPTFANRLITARGLANDLAPLAEGLLTEANSFVEALHHIDDGIRIVVR